MTVYFIGAGPGDPELITLKGLKRLQAAPVVIYAGSLVPRPLLRHARAGARLYDSAPLTLDEIVALMAEAHRRGEDVARLHSGDPALYGAIGEQMRRLDGLGIPYEVIPGVNAFSACAAHLRRELTLPQLSQTVILTRYPGKTPMPEGERLSALARHRATLAIHLAVTRIHKVVAELLPHYGPRCPVAVVHRASWPDAEAVTGTLEDIVAKVRARGFKRTALILVGEVLAPADFADSHLYHPDQAHIHRPRRRS